MRLANDLRFAAEWMSVYETDDPDTAGAAERMTLWLRAEADRRELAGLARRAGLSLPRARAAVARLREKESR